jgi:Flp pilus assembly protein TadG
MAYRTSAVVEVMRAMSTRIGRRSSGEGERGNAAVELAIILPVLLVITFGVVDFARLFYAYITAASAAHEAAVYLAEYPTADDSKLEAVAAGEMSTFLTFSGAGPNTTLTKPALVAATTGSNYVRVQLAYRFEPLVPIPQTGPIMVSAVAAAPRPRPIS